MDTPSKAFTIGYLTRIWSLSALIAFQLLTLSQVDAVHRQNLQSAMNRIEAGTTVSKKSAKGWSHVVLVATPKVTSGDTASVSSLIKEYAEMFTTVITADCVQDAEKKHVLKRLGIGIAISDGAKGLKIVSSGKSPGVGMIASRVLTKAEESLDKIEVIFRSSQAIVFQSPAIVSVGKRHQKLTVRHLVSVDAENGKVSSFVWLTQTQGGEFKTLDNSVVMLSENFRETRRLRVSKSEFTFGLPGEMAFAMEGLPKGKTFQINDAQSAKLAGKSTAIVSTIQQIFAAN